MEQQAKIQQLEDQIAVQCATIDQYHQLEEQWRKAKIEGDKMIEINGKLIAMNELLIKDNLNLKRINEELLKLPERFEDMIKQFHAEK